MSDSESFYAKITAATPSGTSTATTLFDSKTAMGEAQLRYNNIKRVLFNVLNTQPFTLTMNVCGAGGSYATYASQAIAASTGLVQEVDMDVAGFDNIQITVLNANTNAQTVWTPTLTLTQERHTGV